MQGPQRKLVTNTRAAFLIVRGISSFSTIVTSYNGNIGSTHAFTPRVLFQSHPIPVIHKQFSSNNALFSSKIVDLSNDKTTIYPTPDDDNYIVLDDDDDLDPDTLFSSETLRDIYQTDETDGIVTHVASHILETTPFSPADMIVNALESANHVRGKSASILNGILGGCCRAILQLQDAQNDSYREDMMRAAEFAVDLFTLWVEEYSDEVEPDLTSCACAYVAASCFDDDSSGILEYTLQKAKKRGGTRRRKSLVASKKRGAAVNAMDVAEELLKKHDITILCETDDYLGLIKPSGMVCSHAHKTTKGKSIDVSLEDAISRLAIPLSTVNMEMGKGGGSVGGRGIVHRLDRGTSGCILLAKTDEAHLRFVCEFFVRGVEKQYRALIPGVLKENEGELVSRVEGKPARSKYCVEEVYGENTASLIRIKTFTGRKHQVRVQCAKELGKPLFLDPLYSTRHQNPRDTTSQKGSTKVTSPPSNIPKSIQRLATTEKHKEKIFLHAATLDMERCSIYLEAPLPEWWTKAVTDL